VRRRSRPQASLRIVRLAALASQYTFVTKKDLTPLS
jgi:hypothetical protein